eukprot:gene14687-17947_t
MGVARRSRAARFSSSVSIILSPGPVTQQEQDGPAMDTCQSISAAELKNLVHQQLHDCSPAQQVVFAACRVPFYAHTRLRLGELEPVLVV